MSELKVDISAKLCEMDEEIKQKIVNFTNALAALPYELTVDLKILIDEKDSSSNLKLNLGELLTEQVKEHFRKRITNDLFTQNNSKLQGRPLNTRI